MSDITKVNITDNIDNLTLGKKPPYFNFSEELNKLITSCSGDIIWYPLPENDASYTESIYVQEGKMWVTDVKSSG